MITIQIDETEEKCNKFYSNVANLLGMTCEKGRCKEGLLQK